MTDAPLPRGVTLIAPTSGTGKTALAVGISRALHRTGIAVDPFKATSVVNATEGPADMRELLPQGVLDNCAAAGVPVRWWNNPVVAVRDGRGPGRLFVRGEPYGDVTIIGEDSLDLRGLPPGPRAACLQAVDAALTELARRGNFVALEGSGGAGDQPPGADLANDVVPLRAGLPVVLVGNVNREGHLAALAGMPAIMGARYRDLMIGYVLNGVRDDTRLADARARLAAAMPIPELAVVPSYLPPGGYADAPEMRELVYERRADHVAASALLTTLLDRDATPVH